MEPQLFRIGRLDELSSSGGRVFRVAGRQIAVFTSNGTYFAIDNVCPHRGGPLGEGPIDGTVVQCPLHGWRFDVANGQCLDNPAHRVARFRVQVERDELFVELDSNGAQAEQSVAGKYLLVRYGAPGYVGRFQADESNPHDRGCRVVVQTPRGLELGNVLVAAGAAEASAEQLSGSVLRAMTDDDDARARQLCQQQQAEFEICRQCLAEHDTAVELVDAERLLDGESLFLYFLGEATPLLAKISEELSNKFNAQVQFRPFFEAESAGCGTGGCGSGGGGCGGGGCGSGDRSEHDHPSTHEH